MINTLFSMHNIKYVISVDDCYFAPKYEEMKSKVYSEICCSIEPFRTYLIKAGKYQQIKEIDDFGALNTDGKQIIISSFLETLSKEELEGCYKIIEGTDKSFSEEQKGILAFLEELKTRKCIDQYWTIPTASDAAKFDCKGAGITNGSILWLLDRNFERVGESANAGIELAKNLTQRNDGQDNYVYIVSSVDDSDSESSEDAIEAEFDELISPYCDDLKTSSFIYYIHKRRILSNKSDRIAKGLAQGFKRKVCYELFNTYGKCLERSLESASKIIFGIKQQTLNYLFSEKVGGNGESYIDFLTRLVQIFHTEEYNKALTTEHDVISNKLNYFEQLCEAVKDRIGNATEMTDILKDMRKRELYNEHINSRYLELSTGDIFCIDSSYYLLISQSCDTYLRQDGCRKLENANLLKIECGGQSIHEYPLSCFLDIEGPKVRYQTQISIPFDVLDLCVLNSDGQASIDIAYIQKSDKAKLNRHSMIFLMRLRRICEHIQKIYESKLVLEKFISKDTKVTGEDAKAAYTTLLGENPYLKNYKINETKLCYPVQRICRLNELTTVDIVKGYGTFLSRIGHPFDFLK